MKRKISLSTTVTLILLAIALTVSLTMLLSMRYFNNELQQVSESQRRYEHINNVDTIVKKYYPNLDEQLMREGITQGFIDGLGDPYAVYYTPTRYAAESLRLSGKATDTGVTLALDAEGRVVVSRVQSKSSAGKAGVKVGDVVTKVDGNPVESITLNDLHALMSAEKVMLTVQRGEETHPFTVNSVTDMDKAYAVDSVQSTMLGTVGYIRIYGFYDNTPKQFSAALSALQEQGATALIFDLRNNAGGSQKAVQEVLSSVMPLGTYGMMTDVEGNQTKLTSTVSNQVNVSTATLINSGTAGEAEFFAGVLQEASLTTVVGHTSAGKAKYQEYFTLDADASGIKLTVGEYGLLKSGSWEGKGIQPVVTAELPPEQASIFGLLKPQDDAQVKAAMDFISKSDLPLLNTPETTPPEGEKPETDPTESATDKEGSTTDKVESTTDKDGSTTKKEEKPTEKTTKKK